MSAGPANRSFLLTPAGAGAIAVVRVIGPDALDIVGSIFVSASARDDVRKGDADMASSQAPATDLPEGKLRYGLLHVGHEMIDDVIVSRVASHDPPAIDISTHGGVRIVERLFEALRAAGAPPAAEDDRAGADSVGHLWPAENRIAAEAEIELRRARTPRAVRFLLWQRQHLPTRLVRLSARCPSDPDVVRESLRALVDGYSWARVLIDGATVALIGPANSGKSTLFNRLVGRERAIVSDRPGTTRDWVAESVEMDGVPITLIDTAGHRTSADELEREAIAAGETARSAAAITLLVLDGSVPPSAEIRAQSRELLGTPRTLLVITKQDLGLAWEPDVIWPDDPPASGVRVVSARTGAGVEGLCEAVVALLGLQRASDKIPSFFTARQCEAARGVLSLKRDFREAGERTIRRMLLDL